MNTDRITMLASQEELLTRFLDSHPLGHERAAIVLFRRLHIDVPGLERSDRYLAVETIPFPDSWTTSSSDAHVAFELKYFRDLFRRCDDECLVFGFVHNHPEGPSDFSSVDDQNETTLVTAMKNRNGAEIHFIAMLWSKGVWKARIRHGSNPHVARPVRHILIVARPLRIHLNGDGERNDDLFARQAAAFGRPFVDQLNSLRVAVVGAGGTGSPTITLLARAGIGEIIIIDGDKLDRSNLNRVRGASASKVGCNKAHIQKDFVDGLGGPLAIS